jgi:hypothetical protein
MNVARKKPATAADGDAIDWVECCLKRVVTPALLTLVATALAACGGGSGSCGLTNSVGVGSGGVGNSGSCTSTVSGGPPSGGPPGAGNSNVPQSFGSSATASATASNGNALLVLVPFSNTNGADHTSPAGVAATLNQSFTQGPGGGPSSSASITFGGSMAGGHAFIGTGVLNNNNAAPANPTQEYRLQIIDSAGGLTIANIAASRQTNYAGTNYLQNATYGNITYDYTNTGIGYDVIGGYYTGNLTPVSQLPVSATYSGIFLGNQSTAPGAYQAISGLTTVAANFTNGTVTGGVTGINNGYNIFFNGTITGNTYAGTGAFANPTGGNIPAPTFSTVTGGFYGPSASETAGALHIQGQAPMPGGGLSNISVVGGFGAHR